MNVKIDGIKRDMEVLNDGLKSNIEVMMNVKIKGLKEGLAKLLEEKRPTGDKEIHDISSTKLSPGGSSYTVARVRGRHASVRCGDDRG